ncbi:sigma-70 family RNA polymerase sigma factor [Gramella sp. KN1008]|uniref:sigma-70 family RNA polymerase sigma factor n=1 Tax=Gramella sp. KN1008 TaxID=2529298 RepID=UPI00103FD4B8|nr:sigma-70 family RNA polymerase sigma factor [Gramella sp. KN1008]TBW27961.1 sigma-70 family RNA polymerase sigma factor [Gramella sp. KN1008]
MKKMELNRYNDISEHWLEYKEAMRNYILKIVKDVDTANHLSHEVLMKVYSSCCSGRDIKNIRSWLFQISYNTCMDYFKKENKTGEIKGDYKDHQEDLIYKEAGEFIEPLISLLPDKYGKPLTLSDIQGLKQQEVADMIGLSLTATKSRIQRARQMLKDQIMECCHIEVDRSGNLTAFNIKGTCRPLQEHVKNENNSASF